MIFKAQNSPFEKRLNESKRMISKYTDRIPCIIETAHGLNLDKHKYLIPSNLTIGQFITVVRKRIKLGETEALFMFTESNVIPPTSANMSHIYENFKHEDGFLYLWLGMENTFGARD
jgi:GABA(A) receptor-associated protein